jgi:hypothetical protein
MKHMVADRSAKGQAIPPRNTRPEAVRTFASPKTPLPRRQWHPNGGHALRAASAVALAIAMFLAIVSQARAGDGIALFPKSISLFGQQARQSLVVEQISGEQCVGQVHDGVKLSSSDEKIVRIEEGVAVPVANGTATLTAQAGNQSADASATVTGMEQPWEWSFANHVVPVFSKAGCNSGACHGALAGKNGFKLTLFGYDPSADYAALVRQAGGRRIVADDPGRSLVLTKPTGAIAHKGGVRFDVGSPEYRAIAEWIAAGAKPPASSDAHLTQLEVLPKRARLAPGATQQLLVRAHFSNGRSEDVTRWVKFTSSNETVAAVDAKGNVKVMGSGEGAISAWYLNRIEMATITAPYAAPGAASDAPPSAAARSGAIHNAIDVPIAGKLADLNLPASSACDDAAFLRRAMLDTIGVLPTPDEVRGFLADASPDKRDRLVDQLLSRPEFVDYWSYRWSDLLLVNSGKLRPPAVKAYYGWIRQKVKSNTPWDALARELVTAQGSTLENGAANFFVLHQDPKDMAEAVSMSMLGMSIGCAKCHNHPLEKWTNDQYYQMASLFARVRSKNLDGDGNLLVFHAAQGELIQPTTGAVQPPRPLDGALVPESAADRRVPLADWLTSPGNPYFTRAIVNRVWANYFGVGLVEKVDDLRLTNPASNEPLLAALAAETVRSGFDLKHLMREILRSAAYQRDSVAAAGSEADRRYYSRYFPRRLSAEVLLDAISQSTGATTEFAGYPQGTRALQLPDSAVASYFLKSFGRAERNITCECERSAEPSMVQVLHLSNGDTVNEKLEAKGNQLDRLLAANTSDLGIIEEMYLSALSRFPSDGERIKLLVVLGQTPQNERRHALEDIYWAILSGKEFLFNH